MAPEDSAERILKIASSDVIKVSVRVVTSALHWRYHWALLVWHSQLSEWTASGEDALWVMQAPGFYMDKGQGQVNQF